MSMSNNVNVCENFINKILFLQNIVQGVVKRNHIYKTMEIIEASDVNSCIKYAEYIFGKLKTEMLRCKSTAFAEDQALINIQQIITEISTLICLYGCDTLADLISVCIGNNYPIEDKYVSKYKLLNNIHPTKYKILDWKKISTSNKRDEIVIKKADNFDCFEVDTLDEHMDDNFNIRVYGIKVALHNIEKQQTILVYGIVDDMLLELIDNDFITQKLQFLLANPPVHPNFNIKSYQPFIACLSIKEILINDSPDIQENYIEFINNYMNHLNKKTLATIISEFIEQDLFSKRTTLIQLLINTDKNETQYLAYLLYDLLSNDINGIIDTYEQNMIYNSFPCQIKRYFHEAMKQTVNYTNKLSKIDSSKIPLEQQICLLKTEDSVKEKAMIKLKEVKMKSEDTGSKARQYLEGLLKIPFGIYKEEPALKLMSESVVLFNAIINTVIKNDIIGKCGMESADLFPLKTAAASASASASATTHATTTYTSFEVQKYMPLITQTLKPTLQKCMIDHFNTTLMSISKSKILEIYGQLKTLLNTIRKYYDYTEKISVSGKSVIQLREQLIGIIDLLLAQCNADPLQETVESPLQDIIYDFFETIVCQYYTAKLFAVPILPELNENIQLIASKQKNINLFMRDVNTTLDNSVYGHKKAKRQIERIIGQWVNGDLTGYCFGFEGPPGVGKTSLAKKGISYCLKDAAGVSRPFSLIAMGGSSNSSTLDGHNYTYVGSSWGRIVDILMDTKIMNPIIFIDELDKVSKTENGKEIIGILTHLIDQTQNDIFQDKYFNGVNLNLSKALFIFSYNDVDAIDRILLDRIHRIKFEHLSLEDKLVITRNFILPEIYAKMGLLDMLEISDEIIEFIIEEYTAEPGVRKLKEIIFEIVGEINLLILKNDKDLSELPIPLVVTKKDIKTKYLKERREINPMKIHATPCVGVINGLWANSVGKGGVLPIEASFFPCSTFLELKLTGMQGEVMKESMTVAKSLAWSLFLEQNMAVDDDITNTERIKQFSKRLEDTKTQGLHIHVPEGATPKDGPSAGTAITMVMYSLFSGRKINNNIAITGEICLQGRVTAIGGLDLKILGGIRAGVKLFIFPKENEKDYKDFLSKYENKTILQDIKFVAVENIEEVIPLIFI